MAKEFIVPAQSGAAFEMKQGETVTVIDLYGSQVVDFFAVGAANPDEILSAGATIDINESLKLKRGDKIYTNLYREMFEIVYDDVEEHDLIHPCCRPEMYDFFYHNGENHPNCFDNISRALKQKFHVIHPVNLFMHTAILPDGKIEVKKPLSKAGDRVILLAKMDVTAGLAACSVSESQCNGGKCSPVKVIIG